MKVLFLTLANIDNIEQSGIYQDLLRKFRDNGHDVTIVCPVERKFKKPTHKLNINGVSILKVWSPNFQKTNIFEKGLTTLSIEYIFFFAIKKFINYKNVDLILYSTPPITFTNLITKIKKDSNAKTYLLLKDIFPQNAVDLNLLKKNSFIYKYFRKKETLLYTISDHIGCMSAANMTYLIKNNSFIDPEKIEINPNSIEIKHVNLHIENKESLFEKYHIPNNKVLFLLGGNLGLPQGIDYLKENIKYCKNIVDSFFLIVGNGTEYKQLQNWLKNENISNACLIGEMSKTDFNQLLSIVNVGLIFLNPLFTIPNFPSRLLSYLEHKLPIICATDKSTDIGEIAEANEFGFNCLTSDKASFFTFVNKLLDKNLRSKMGENGYQFLLKEYNSKNYYIRIVEKFNQN